MTSDPKTDRQRLDDAIAECDEVIDGILRAPRMWGPPLAQELQFLLTCEMKLTLHGRPSRGLKDEWLRFVSKKLPGTSVVYYANDRCDGDTMLAIMREFVEGRYVEMLHAP